MIDDMPDVDFYSALWTRLVGDGFSVEKLLHRVRIDGGVDIEDLSDSDLRDLIEERYAGDWSKVAFTGSEMLASYSVAGGMSTPDQVVGWVFASLILSDAIKADAADWYRNFDNFLNGFFAVREKLAFGEALAIFERAFQASHT